MTQELVIVEQKPAEIVVGGRDAAKELTKIVSSRKKKLVMGGKQYLFFEDWQTIGKFYGVTAKVIHTEELKEGDTLIGFMAQAVAVTSAIEVSAADAECTYDEPNWKNKPRFQLRSMAQTRACAKALRNCLGWVAVLAGYEPTPAEEMSGVELQHSSGSKAKITTQKTAPLATAQASSPPEPANEETKNQTENLLQWVAENMKFKTIATARNWLVNVAKIENSRIDTEPQEVIKEVAQLQGWAV